MVSGYSRRDANGWSPGLLGWVWRGWGSGLWHSGPSFFTSLLSLPPYLNGKGWEKSLLGPHFTALVAWQGILWKVAPALYYHPPSTGLLSSYPGLLAALDHFGPLTSMGASGPPLAQVGFSPHTKLQPCQADPLLTPKEIVLKGQCLWHYLPHPSLHPLKVRVQEWQVSL